MAETKSSLPVSFAEKVPEMYMPRLQLFIRYMLVTITGAYFNFSPIPPLFLTSTQINLIILFYYVFHIFLWWHYRKYGPQMIMIRLGLWVDTAAAATALLCDPFIMPATVLVLLIAALGNGIQHGFQIFVECMVGALLLGSVALVFHSVFLGSWPPYNLYFCVFFIVVAVFYSYLLVQRLELVKTEAIRASEYDILTGMLNRRAFLRAAEYLLLLNERANIFLVFIFADLDNFKAVNDKFGHDMGDKVLRHFSDVVRSSFRKSDIIARYGGDEFVMILTNSSIKSAESVLQRIQDDFRSWAQNNELPTGVSFGLAMAAEGKNNLEDILKQADAALYKAKRIQ